jgi:Uncharacterised nucleotidyltransferase
LITTQQRKIDLGPDSSSHTPYPYGRDFAPTPFSIGMGRERATLPPRAAVLSAIDTLIDRARTVEDLEHHGLQLFAVRRWRALGRPVPDRLVDRERLAALISLAAPAVLERIRGAYGGNLLLLKGPEAAVAYPDPCLRPWGDIDLLVSDSRAAQRALLAAGFEPLGDERRYVGLHHCQPLRLPGLPVAVELHHAPKWPKGLQPPSASALFEIAVSARCGSQGILGLPPAHHALVLAAHAWAHAPLGHMRHLIDISLVAADAGRTDWEVLAERWGAARLWDTTVHALAAIFGSAHCPAAVKLWARHIRSVRERTVLETHLASWMSPLWSFSGFEAFGQGAAAVATDLLPLPGESWRDKLVRTRLAMADASLSASHHHRLREATASNGGAPVMSGDGRRQHRDAVLRTPPDGAQESPSSQFTRPRLRVLRRDAPVATTSSTIDA